jgi:hypothetical protein
VTGFQNFKGDDKRTLTTYFSRKTFRLSVWVNTGNREYMVELYPEEAIKLRNYLNEVFPKEYQ